MGLTLPNSQCLTKTALIAFTAMYALCNLILAIMATIAVKDAGELTILCFFIAATSSVCFGTAMMMAIHGFLRSKSHPVIDPLYFLRGIIFTLVVLAPLILFGWYLSALAMTTPDVPGTQPGLNSAFATLGSTGFMIHFTFIFGLNLAGIACALAPAAGSQM